MNHKSYDDGGEKTGMRQKSKYLFATALTAALTGNAAAQTAETDSGLGVQLGRIAETLGTAIGNFLSSMGTSGQMVVGMMVVLGTAGIGYFLTGENETVGVVTLILSVIVMSIIGLFPTWIAPAIGIIAAAFVAKWGASAVGGA